MNQALCVTTQAGRAIFGGEAQGQQSGGSHSKSQNLLLCGYTWRGLSVHMQRSRLSWLELTVMECHLMGRSS